MLERELLQQVQRPQEKCLIAFEGHKVGHAVSAAGGDPESLSQAFIPAEEGQSLPLGAAYVPVSCPKPSAFLVDHSLQPRVWTEGLNPQGRHFSWF